MIVIVSVEEDLFCRNLHSNLVTVNFFFFFFWRLSSREAKGGGVSFSWRSATHRFVDVDSLNVSHELVRIWRIMHW